MIDSFDGKYRFLSNFYNSKVIYEGLEYLSIEAAFQAAKTTDIMERLAFTKYDPSQAKKEGRRIKLRSDWEKIKLGVMENLVRQKFNQPSFKEKLIGTGNEELVEGNWWNDTFWGVCNGEGQNNLGKILMKIRKEIS